jgi:probable HAF family extracellular repeat protein
MWPGQEPAVAVRAGEHRIHFRASKATKQVTRRLNMKLQGSYKSRMFANIVAATLFAAMAMPVGVLAQGNAVQEQSAAHHHYKLVDLGTFGGPLSTVFLAEDNYNPILNNRGTVAGLGDTSAPDPFPAFCFFDCFVSHAFQWQKGVTTDLGALPGGASSASAWISANGLIAGWSENGLIDPLFPGFPESHAVLWKDGEIIDLGTVDGGYESVANAVNNRGQVVGAAANAVPDLSPMSASNFGWTTETRAFLWQNGVMVDLGTLGGPDAVALLINEWGQIVGDSYTSSVPSPYCANIGFPLTTGAFLWQNGKMVGLGSLGGTCTFAFDLNNRGQVIGGSTLAGDLAQHPFLWDRGVLSDLGTLGGSSGNAIAINDGGEITGFANEQGDQTVHAFLWKNGTMTDLGTVGGDPCSVGFSINARGQVVGISAAAALPTGCDFSQTRAFLSEAGGPPIDLNTLIPTDSALHLAAPATINDRGEIAGFGFLPNGDQHAFLLIPCDENETDTEGCDYSLVAATTSAQLESPQNIQLSAPTSAVKLSPREVMNRVRSLRAGRNRLYGMPQTLNTASAITNIEPAPTSLTSFAFKRGLYDVVELSWTDHSTDADSHHIERCTGSTCTNFSEIAVTGGSATRYIDPLRTMHLTFRYRVRAHSQTGYSGYSNIRTQITP